jgi:hypothetical protein
MLDAVEFIKIIIVQESLHTVLVSVDIQSIQQLFASICKHKRTGPKFGPFALLNEDTPGVGTDGPGFFLIFIRFFKGVSDQIDE